MEELLQVQMIATQSEETATLHMTNNEMMEVLPLTMDVMHYECLKLDLTVLTIIFLHTLFELILEAMAEYSPVHHEMTIIQSMEMAALNHA